MTDPYPDDDNISETSTVLSEQREEYEVETVLAEDLFEDGVRYLVKWDGYDLERCTWEPASSFSTSETLRDWEEKKRGFKNGSSTPFDVEAWNKTTETFYQEREDRKRRREAKRRRKAQTHANNTDSQTNPILSSARNQSRTSRHFNESRTLDSSSNASETLKSAPPPVPFRTGARPSHRPGPARLRGSNDPGPFRRFNLSERWRHEKRKRDEPCPDRGQLELFKPSEYPARSGADITRRNSNVGSRSGDTSTPGCSAQNYTTRPIVASSGAPPFNGNMAPEVRTARLPGNQGPPFVPGSSRKEIEMDNSRHQNQREDTPILPRRIPEETARHAGPDLWWNLGEVLVHIVYGPKKEELGAARLCNLGPALCNQIIKQKTGIKNIIWFETLLTLAEYEVRCDRHTPYDQYRNGWIEGFTGAAQNTELNLYRFSQKLFRENRVAIASVGKSVQELLVIFPPKSRDFLFLGRDFREPEGVFLCTAMKLPRRGQARPYPRPEPVRSRSAKEANAVSDRYPKTISGSNMHDQQPQQQTQLSGSIRSKSNPSDQGELVDIGRDPGPEQRRPRQEDNVQNRLSQLTGDSDLDTFFQDLGVTFDVLSVIDKEKSTRASCFYVMFPQEPPANAEYSKLKEFINGHYKPVFSSAGGEDWENFLRLENGVLLLHESLMFNYMEPWYKYVVQRPSWVFSLSTPLPYVGEKKHFQRLFPSGLVMLITEDFMLQRQDATLIVLTWFYDMANYVKFPGNWKVMLRPNILNWLEFEFVRKESRPGLWLAIYNAITRLNQSDGVCFGEIPDGTSDDFEMSSVISPGILGYGSRAENDHWDIPKNLTQEERDTDHLVEFFSGWALVHSHRFKRFVICTTMTPPERWNKWQHVEILKGANAIYNSFKFESREYWAKVAARSGSSGETESVQPTTPFTPRTPVAHPSRMDGSRDAKSRDHSTRQVSSARREYPQTYR